MPITNYIRAKAVADMLGITVQTVYVWVKQNRFPAPYQLSPGRINGPIAWRVDEVEAWLASRPRGYSALDGPIKRYRDRQRAARAANGHYGGTAAAKEAVSASLSGPPARHVADQDIPSIVTAALPRRFGFRRGDKR